MLRPTTLYWAVVLAGLAPFYLYNRLNLKRAFVSRTPRGLAIRLCETAAVLLYLAVVWLAEWDFALTGSSAVPWIGLAVAAAGAALASWAKIRLRQYFSVILGVQRDHRLITTGPYALVRHPMYTGLLLVAIGGAMVANSGAVLLLLAAPFAGFFWWQSAEEEKQFLAHFGDEYRRYRSRTRRFF